MYRRQLKALQYDQLIELPLDDLIYVAESLRVSIDDLLEAPTTVSSKTSLTTLESPGIISVLNETDITPSGAQDLAGLLRTIPGIYFGNDVDGVKGIIVRGNWGHEGKVLFLIDDMELNENMYSVTQLLNHIPAAQISRVEVIRGPGSALYGGYAELGVVKITTHNGKGLQGAQITATAGTFGSGINSNGVSLLAGTANRNSTWSVMGSWSMADAAKGEITDFDDEPYNLQDGWLNSKNLFLNMKYAWKGLETQLLFDDYSIAPIGYESVSPNRFRSYLSQMRKSFKASDKFILTPSVTYKSQVPYWFENPSDVDYWFYKRIAQQLNTVVDLIWIPKDKIQVISGAGYRIDRARITKQEQELVGETFYNNSYSLNHSTLFAYSQVNFSGKLGNLLAE